MNQPELYKPGTHLTVGSHQIVITKYFSHGGFAQVYTCTINPHWNNKNVACLKRVNVPDKGSLNTLRKEVDAMRKLQGINCIVSYIDSHAARSVTGGYEVFVLMEYCSRKGLIDFMNTRLVNKLSESEILVIMQNISEAVAHMHALSPPLIHRDIKIENVLLGDDGSYKLCDFGSVSTIINPPLNAEEFQIIQDDIMKNTTPQYRAPEMLDLYRRQPINEKSDVWALGVFLYKLCYFTTPFEQNAINNNMNGYSGDYAIINGIYSIPSTPLYSSRMKNMIAKLLTVDPNVRPNCIQLLEEVCKMRGVPCPIITKSVHLQYNPVSMKSTQASSSIYSNNNIKTESSLTPSITTPISVTGVSNSVAGKSINTPSTSSLFKYNGLKNSINSAVQSKRIETPPSNNKELSPPKVRNSKTSSSLHGQKEIKNFMSEIETEEVEFNSPFKVEMETVSSSIDYLKSISRQNTNNDNPDSRYASKSKKRSSITSIKNLLTGGSSKSSFYAPAPATQPSRSNSLRKSSIYSNKRNSSVDSLPDNYHKFKNMNSSLSDLQEMSPEAKTTKKFDSISMKSPLKQNKPVLSSPSKSIPPTTSANSNDGLKRNPSIQSRVKNLFRNASPPPLKTAHGYGKYTEFDEHLNREPVKSAATASSELFMSKDTSLSNNTPRHAKSLNALHPTNSRVSLQKKVPTANVQDYDNTGSSYFAINDINNSSISGNNSTNSPSLAFKRKPPPPPKPKKPEYLKGSTDQPKTGRYDILDEDLDTLERRFEIKFPGVV